MKNNKSTKPGSIPKPVKRSALRNRLGLIYYSFLRHMLWLTMRSQFPIPFLIFTLHIRRPFFEN